MNFQKVDFLISAAAPKDFPKDRLPEIAFAGKSNVGKSSVINRILQRKNFARVGDKPGKTIHVNYFTVDSKCYFVDLPGYGFAKVSEKEKARWGKLMEDYFAADRIDLGVLIVDYRHPPTNNDITYFIIFSYEKQGFFRSPQGKNQRKNCPKFSEKSPGFCAIFIDKKW